LAVTEVKQSEFETLQMKQCEIVKISFHIVSSLRPEALIQVHV